MNDERDDGSPIIAIIVYEKGYWNVEDVDEERLLYQALTKSGAELWALENGVDIREEWA